MTSCSSGAYSFWVTCECFKSHGVDLSRNQVRQRRVWTFGIFATRQLLRAWVVASADLVSSFLVDGPPLGQVFSVEPGSLFRPGFTWHRQDGRHKRRTEVTWPRSLGRVGDMATLAEAPHVGKLVIVVGMQTRLDWSAVSASLDTCKYFSCGHGSPSENTWPVCRVHMAGRLFALPEASCEMVGSVMQLVWDGRQALSPGRMEDRALLSMDKVKCIGGIRDEVLVAEVVELLVQMGRRATTHSYKRGRGENDTSSKVLRRVRRAHEDRLGEVGHGVGEVEGGLLADPHPFIVGLPSTVPGLTCSRRMRKKASEPVQLNASLRRAVQIATRDNRVLPLPMFKEDARTARKERAGSSLRDALLKWMNSEEGADWKRERQQMYDGAGGMEDV